MYAKHFRALRHSPYNMLLTCIPADKMIAVDKLDTFILTQSSAQRDHWTLLIADTLGPLV